MVTIERLKRGYMGAREAGDKDKMDKYAAAIRSLQTSQEAPGFSLYKTMENIPGSAVNYGADIANAVMNPIDTAKAMGNLALGGVQKLIPGEQDSEVYADALGQFLVDRYGSVDNALGTIQGDPVGFLGDLSTVFLGGGGVLKAAGASRAGNVVERAGALVEPFNVIKQGLQAGRVLPDSVPQKLYESSAKYSTTLPPEQRRALVETGLGNRLTPNRRGVEKGASVLSDLDNQIDVLVEQAESTGNRVHKNVLFKYLSESRDKFGGPKLDAASDLGRIDQVARAFDEHLKSIGQEYLSPKEIQEFKKGVYARINYDKKAGRTREAVEHAQKGMARSAKEEMEKLSPDLKDTNRKWGDMREWLDQSERSAGRIENRDVLGIGVPIKAVAGSAIGGDAGGVMGLVQGLADSPTLKARIAIGMRKLKEDGLDNPTSMAVMRDMLFQAGRSEEEIKELLGF